ncbi:hypothetical protein [Bacillus wiedmannii]|uniref:Uncharacterized protein n=1 Tax=Bacillus wiedmannii TaxID=1890302 RepID=A0ABD6TMM7_9BACI|nr:hypothetical protein [Bacillus wiedmannii]PEO58308.1 hypothetical protein CN560_12250 [Bacillus wiedmannii]PGC75958.1 hypothetical protein COM25_10075 [Bacillus wiedmannii]PHG19445.1 hypothetical protein COI74_17915 [Bacillus wiedmannii]
MIFKENSAPIILMFLGVLLGIGLYNFDTFQLNAINIGAFFLTVSCVNQGSVTSKINDRTIKFFRKLNVLIGILMIIAALLASGFKYYDLIESLINKVDTNALLLIGIAITLWSFKTSDIYNANALMKEKKKAEVNHRKYLKETEEKLNYQKEKLEYQEKNRCLKEHNNELVKYLEEATKTVEKLQEELEKRKNNGE